METVTSREALKDLVENPVRANEYRHLNHLMSEFLYQTQRKLAVSNEELGAFLLEQGKFLMGENYDTKL